MQPYCREFLIMIQMLCLMQRRIWNRSKMKNLMKTRSCDRMTKTRVLALVNTLLHRELIKLINICKLMRLSHNIFNVTLSAGLIIRASHHLQSLKFRLLRKNLTIKIAYLIYKMKNLINLIRKNLMNKMENLKIHSMNLSMQIGTQ